MSRLDARALRLASSASVAKRFNGCSLVLALLSACARAPAPEPIAAEPPPEEGAPVEPPSEAPTPRVTVARVGDETRRAAALAMFSGVWAFEREVWVVEGERVEVYRPADAEPEILVERRLELLAPCMFVVHEGERRLGPYQLDTRFERQAWTRDGVAAAVVERGVFTLCTAQHVVEVAGDRCEAWRYDADAGDFDASPLVCEHVRVPPKDPGSGLEKWVVRLDEGDATIELPIQYRLQPGPDGAAVGAPNLGSACGMLPLERGCSSAQSELLRSLHWAALDGACTSAKHRVEFEEEFANVLVVGPRRCLLAAAGDPPLLALDPGIVERPSTASVRAGGRTKLTFVFENTAAEVRTLRLPTRLWRVSATRDDEPVKIGSCLGLVGTNESPGANTAEFRLEPGGTLTVVIPWTATGVFVDDHDCEVRSLPKGRYELAIAHELDPTIVLHKSVRVK